MAWRLVRVQVPPGPVKWHLALKPGQKSRRALAESLRQIKLESVRGSIRCRVDSSREFDNTYIEVLPVHTTAWTDVARSI